MNKNLIAVIGIILVAIIAYQAYLLGKKEAVATQSAQKPQPRITVEIEKPRPAAHPSRNTLKEVNATDFDEKALQAKVKEDFNRLIKDIFGNPKVKAEIRQNLQQMQQELQQGMNEFQKALVSLSAQFQQAASQDPLLQEIFKNIPIPKALQFEDRGSRYELHLQVPKDAKSSVDLKVANGYLVVLIHHVTKERHEENGAVVEKELIRNKEVLVSIPQDALVEKLQTKYDDGNLTVTIPKIVAPKATT